MRYVRAVDGRDHTVIMVQVENEVAMIDEAADRSAPAQAAFAAPVPKELLARFPGKAAGTWEQVFGRGPAAEEMFMAWHYARYVETVARAGKTAYPLPMLTNAALNRPGKKPGQYPSGGPLPHLFDAWKAGAPSLDLLAPDIYLPDFVTWCDRYQRPGNPLFIPEAKNDADAAVHALYAIGRGALGFSPFAIESTRATADAAALTKALRRCWPSSAPLLAAAGAGKTRRRAARQGAPDGDVALRRISTSACPRLHVRVGVARAPRSDLAARRRPHRRDRARRIHRRGQRHHRHVPARRASRRHRARRRGPRRRTGKFVVTRRLNGDETHQGRHLRLPMGALGVQRVKANRSSSERYLAVEERDVVDPDVVGLAWGRPAS